jgi:hypothetical protein
MKKTPLVLKIGVVAFSLSLMAWFVAYRAGAFDTAKADAASAVPVSTVPAPSTPAVALSNPDTIPESLWQKLLESDGFSIAASSKSGTIFPEPKRKKWWEAYRTTTNDTPPPRQVTVHQFYMDESEVMSGSKNEAIFTPPREEVDTPEKEDRTIMGSSKSAPIFDLPKQDTGKQDTIR